jgi:hypothetical protein
MNIQEKRIKVISSHSVWTRNSGLVKPGEKSRDTIPLIRILFGRRLHDDIHNNLQFSGNQTLFPLQLQSNFRLS